MTAPARPPPASAPPPVRRYGALLGRYLAPQRGHALLLAALLLAGIGLQLAVPQVLRRFIDTATGVASGRCPPTPAPASPASPASSWRSRSAPRCSAAPRRSSVRRWVGRHQPAAPRPARSLPAARHDLPRRAHVRRDDRAHRRRRHRALGLLRPVRRPGPRGAAAPPRDPGAPVAREPLARRSAHGLHGPRGRGHGAAARRGGPCDRARARGRGAGLRLRRGAPHRHRRRARERRRPACPPPLRRGDARVLRRHPAGVDGALGGVVEHLRVVRRGRARHHRLRHPVGARRCDHARDRLHGLPVPRAAAGADRADHPADAAAPARRRERRAHRRAVAGTLAPGAARGGAARDVAPGTPLGAVRGGALPVPRRRSGRGPEPDRHRSHRARRSPPRPVGSHGERQDDPHPARLPLLRPGRGPGPVGRRRRPRRAAVRAAAARRSGDSGSAAGAGDRARQPDVLRCRGRGRTAAGGARGGRARRVARRTAGRARHARARRWRQPLGRRGAAARDGARVPGRSRAGVARRTVEPPRPGHRAPPRGRPGAPAARPHRRDHRPPPRHRRPGRCRRRPRRRRRDRARPARRARGRPHHPLRAPAARARSAEPGTDAALEELA
jgi:hypothetical protein